MVDLRKKEEKEFHQNSKELFLEAQNAVREREEAYNQVTCYFYVYNVLLTLFSCLQCPNKEKHDLMNN